MLRELFSGIDVKYLRGITEAEFEVSPDLIEMSFDSGADLFAPGPLEQLAEIRQASFLLTQYRRAREQGRSGGHRVRGPSRLRY
jgi:hypothetical protein